MDDPDEVTRWLTRLGNGDEAAAEAIWQRYFHKLVQVARKRLQDMPRRVADEEDVALSAMDSFCRGVAAGRFPRLRDRHDLWKLLVTITARKATQQMKRHFAKKRGEGRVHGESVWMRPGAGERQGGIGQVLGEEPDPEFACQVAETLRRLLDRLDNDDLRKVALLKMEGYTNEEVAKLMDCVERTVERKLARIREAWEEEQGDQE
ncbi:MAG TPA: RNA polymerase subunit sigma-70 [Planctomycetaceae bacterium]|nr:RNA polymerase subunit sigma-70 [Planctomycetaceae bacterium]HIQ21524.1 RNA polymerase subunit sigma-70 [Planctomycetota bacterium]